MPLHKVAGTCSGFVHVKVLIREGLSELGSLRLEFVQFHWRRG